MADYNQGVTLLEAGASGVTVNGSAPATIAFAGTDANQVQAFRAGDNVPIYETRTIDNPAWELHRRTTIAKGDEWIACLDLRGRTNEGYAACEGLYDQWQALLNSFPPRRVTRTVRVGTRQVGAVNNRVVRRWHDQVFLLQHRQADTLAGVWRRGTEITVTTPVGTALHLQWTRRFIVARDVDFSDIGKLTVSSSNVWCLVPVVRITQPTVAVPPLTVVQNANVRRGRFLWVYRDSEESEQVERDTSPVTYETRQFCTFVVRWDATLLDDGLLRSALDDEDGRRWEMVGADRIDQQRIALRCERTA